MDRNIIKTLSKVREASEDPDLIEYLEEIGSSLALPDILGLLNYQVRLFEQCQMPNQPEFVQPAGLCAESARAVTGRRCPYSGEGEDFLSCQLGFFYENCCISGTESRKIVPEVGKERAVYQNWGRMAKLGFLDQKTRFWAQKKTYTS